LDPERWQQLKKLFEEALDKSASERAAFLDEACREDQSLRKEVEALLNTCTDDAFLEEPAYEAAPELFESGEGDSLIGTQLGPYDVIRKIGKGGMGIVYLARDTRLDRPVAIKMLAPRLTSDSKQRERLKREARAAAKFSHPGIATVYSLEELGESVYIVSEYVQGSTLRQIMDGGPVAFPQILDVAIQIARALAAAHDQGIIHRDLKPENVVLTEFGVIKILDFGLARVVPRNGAAGADPRLTHRGMFLGTPAYSSPEQLLGSEVDEGTDIFSYGLMLYELAAGRHPFLEIDTMATVARILEAEIQELPRVNPAIPAKFDSIVRRCLNKRLADRYSSVHDLLIELEQLRDGSGEEWKARSAAPFWWWQFHQAVAGFGYYLMLYPLWKVKKWIGGVEGSLLFFPALIAVGVAANLRLHLWFTSKYYSSELPDQRHRVSPWIRWADYLFAFMLAVSAIRIHTMHAIIATLLMAVAIGSLVAFLLIEPTTASAALDKKE
jgi:tRNA A-37 threonylcarbamoyl transferase component Bud32